MVQDSERAWLLVKKDIPLTATALARGSGISKYDTRQRLWAQRLFEPDHKLQPNRHMSRGVTCEPAILAEFFHAVGAAESMESHLMCASWDQKSGATPDAGAVLAERDRREEIINVEAKAPMFNQSTPPALYMAQQHQQCATMGVIRSFLVMSDTRGRRISFESRFSPPFYAWCYRRARAFQVHLAMEEPLGPFSSMDIHPFVEERFASEFRPDAFAQKVRSNCKLPLRRPRKSRPDKSREGGRLFDVDQRALPLEFLPPSVPNISVPRTCCYTRATSVGKDAIREGLLEYEF